MKKNILFLFLMAWMGNLHAQQAYADSLLKVFYSAGADTVKVAALRKLSQYYSFLYPDSAIYYADTIIGLSKKAGYKQGEAIGYICKADALDRFASYPEALEAAHKSLEISKTLSTHRLFMTGWSYETIGHIQGITGNSKQAIEMFHTAIDFLQRSGEDSMEIYITYVGMAFSMLQSQQMDSAVYYISKLNENPHIVYAKRRPDAWLVMGNIYNAKGDTVTAENCFRNGIAISETLNTLFLSTIFYLFMADILLQKEERDSSIYYAKRSLSLAQKNKYKLFEVNSSAFLAFNIYEGVNTDSALKYLKILLIANNDAFNADRGRQFQKASYEAEKRERDLADAKRQFRNKIRVYLFTAALLLLFIVAIIFWRYNSQKKKANRLLVAQKVKLEAALDELKSTQGLLIQSEKLASLGELTAGIAHEIQNPLNFVNNFSEVSREMIDELKSQKSKLKTEEQDEILNEIDANLEKIVHHGKRAEGIVKSMLQHSRNSSGKKELTDINALCDEYLRLAYHGLRAKDKSFNTKMKTDFDTSIGNINIIPQDIGRVILNLINNAFYAVDEKAKSLTSDAESYEPMVIVSTKKSNGKAEISIRDNGNGIPKKVVDKIFQPFFTTKPTGQGTGLGLSLAYDIVKAHGGELKVETQEGGGSEFIVSLPY